MIMGYFRRREEEKRAHAQKVDDAKTELRKEISGFDGLLSRERSLHDDLESATRRLDWGSPEEKLKAQEDLDKAKICLEAAELVRREMSQQKAAEYFIKTPKGGNKAR